MKFAFVLLKVAMQCLVLSPKLIGEENAYGHTTLKARHPVRSVKLSNVGPG